MSLGLFVTGTDTGVGKTVVSCALLRGLRLRHAAVVGMKPVAAGITGDALDDIAQLRAASSLAVAAELDNPYALAEPVSPHIAARRAGVQIDIALIVSRYRQLAGLAQAVVVEGAGGFCVPLGDVDGGADGGADGCAEGSAGSGADLAQALGLPVVLVVGLRLGCLNHALLTQEAIQARGLRLGGWVANRIDPRMLAQQDNIDALRRRLAAPLLAELPWHGDAAASGLSIALPENFFATA